MSRQLRLWCLQIPFPKVPPVIVAGKAISESNTAKELLVHLKEIIRGLLAKGIRIVSYAADGTEVERCLQRLLTSEADNKRTYTINHPGQTSGHGTFSFTIPIFGGQPIAMVQDSKHALKTGRNQLLSGAHLGILGNYPLFYTQVRNLATSKTGPLYNRDVEKLDRQDDNAATRLFCAETLKWLTEHHDDQRGLIVYLFVIGEAVDAYQNRNISHGERIQMLLRAMFFMEGWEGFVLKAGYQSSKHFISREYRDILQILVSGFFQLVIIHRDFLDDVYAFLPWFHSTEVCEHLFGMMRSILKDFTMLDFVYMIPKLFIRVREHVLNMASPTGKARASGYNHTHADCDGIDLSLLSIFPSDDEINQLTIQAFEEAQNLLAITGIIPTSSTGSKSVLPGISNWFSGSDHHNTPDDKTDKFGGIHEADDSERTSDREELEDDISNIFHHAERKSLFNSSAEIEGLGYAAIISSVGDSMHM